LLWYPTLAQSRREREEMKRKECTNRINKETEKGRINGRKMGKRKK
jgi:hypothetical protein